MLFDQTLEEIRQEISQAEISGVSDEEYIAMLSRHISNLVELVEQINSDSGKPESFESVLRLLFKNLSEPICVVDGNLNPLFYNSCWKKQFKGNKGNFLLKELLTKKDYSALQGSVEDAGHEYKRKLLTLKIEKNRKIVSILPFLGFDKKTKFLLIAFADDMVNQITEAEVQNKKRDKPEIWHNDPGSFQEEILNLIDGFYFVMDEKLTFQFVSSRVQEQLGLRPTELINRKLTDILSPGSENAVREVVNNSSAAKNNTEKKFKLEVELKDDGNNNYFYDLNLSRNYDKGLWMGICIKIHESKMREEHLISERDNAELNDKMKSNFLANMSHEIRTPLNGIIGFSSMLSRDEISSEKRDKYLRIIRSSTTHLLTLVSDIIDHSKIEAGQLKILTHKFNVHQVFDDLLATFITEAKRLEKKDLRIIKQVPKSGSELIIKCDEVRLKQVLNNLIGNALKFTPDGKICFGYSLESKGSIRFFVRDSGVGLTQSAQKTVFNRFKQTREGKKEKHDGTGLGLAISKGIVELMGGKIGVNSEPGEGSEFYFILPLEECE